MISMELGEDVDKILSSIPNEIKKSNNDFEVEKQVKEMDLGIKNYQTTMLFSATMSPEIQTLTKAYLRSPIHLSIGNPGSGKKEITQLFEFVTQNNRKSRLIEIFKKTKNEPAMVFVNHKNDVDHIASFLN